MKCLKPFQDGAMLYGCGQCLACRINRRRIWTHRLMLESTLHSASSFLTLTYNDENLPRGGSLDPSDLQKFLKRLRKYFAEVRLRYFAVGEYGDISFRPHFHLALFGLGPVVCGGLSLRGDPLKTLWGKGHVFAGDLSEQSSAYVAGYVCKKMTSKDDPRLNGKHPEFSRMSLKPGLGAGIVEQLAKSLFTDVGVDSINENGDVPGELRHGKKKWPLGRYLKRRLRVECGFGSPDTPKGGLVKAAARMRELSEKYLADPENRSKSLRKIVLDKSLSDVASLVYREKVYKLGPRRQI